MPWTMAVNRRLCCAASTVWTGTMQLGRPLQIQHHQRTHQTIAQASSHELHVGTVFHFNLIFHSLKAYHVGNRFIGPLSIKQQAWGIAPLKCAEVHIVCPTETDHRAMDTLKRKQRASVFPLTFSQCRDPMKKVNKRQNTKTKTQVTEKTGTDWSCIKLHMGPGFRHLLRNSTWLNSCPRHPAASSKSVKTILGSTLLAGHLKQIQLLPQRGLRFSRLQCHSQSPRSSVHVNFNRRSLTCKPRENR